MSIDNMRPIESYAATPSHEYIPNRAELDQSPGGQVSAMLFVPRFAGMLGRAMVVSTGPNAPTAGAEPAAKLMTAIVEGISHLHAMDARAATLLVGAMFSGIAGAAAQLRAEHQVELEQLRAELAELRAAIEASATKKAK